MENKSERTNQGQAQTSFHDLRDYGAASSKQEAKDTDTDTLCPTRMKLWSLHGAVTGTQSATWEQSNLGQRTKQVSLGFL